jgi:NADPH2:quinone reductase
VSSEAKAEFCRSLCPDIHPIFYAQQNFVEAVQAWTGGEGVEMALDTVGGKVFQQTFDAMQIYGDVVSLLAPAADTNWKVARDKNLRISLELMLTPALQERQDLQRRQAQILAESAHLFDTGKLRVQVAHQLPLREAARAHQLLAEGKIHGKIVLLTDS